MLTPNMVAKLRVQRKRDRQRKRWTDAVSEWFMAREVMTLKK